MTDKSYACISMDPNWEELGGGGRGAQNHYSVMQLSEIAKVIIRSGVFRPTTSAHLWCWVTNNFLLDGLGLIDQLGFRYVRKFEWVKLRNRQLKSNKRITPESTTLEVARAAQQIGLGKYGRGSHETLLFAVHKASLLPDGAPPDVFFAEDLTDVFYAERTRHSVKPAEAYQLMERVSPGPRLEMFARAHRPGWDVWGDEVPAAGAA